VDGKPCETIVHLLKYIRPENRVNQPNIGSPQQPSPPVDSVTSLVYLMPKTGRTHQLRIHLAHAGYPILGDAFYGDLASRDSSTSLRLHALSLRFKHPADLRTISLEAMPCPFHHLNEEDCRRIEKLRSEYEMENAGSAFPLQLEGSVGWVHAEQASQEDVAYTSNPQNIINEREWIDSKDDFSCTLNANKRTKLN